MDTGAVPDIRARIGGLLHSSGVPLEPASLRIDGGQVGDGYATIPGRVLASVREILSDDGIVFDVTYAGRALAGLREAWRNGVIGRTEPALLVHTGGAPGLFGHPGLLRPGRSNAE